MSELPGIGEQEASIAIATGSCLTGAGVFLAVVNDKGLESPKYQHTKAAFVLVIQVTQFVQTVSLSFVPYSDACSFLYVAFWEIPPMPRNRIHFHLHALSL